MRPFLADLPYSEGAGLEVADDVWVTEGMALVSTRGRLVRLDLPTGLYLSGPSVARKDEAKVEVKEDKRGEGPAPATLAKVPLTIRLTLPGPASLRPGGLCGLVVEAPGWPPTDWSWTLLDADGGLLRAKKGRPNMVDFTAAEVTASRNVRIRVFDPKNTEDYADFTLAIVPSTVQNPAAHPRT